MVWMTYIEKQHEWMLLRPYSVLIPQCAITSSMTIELSLTRLLGLYVDFYLQGV